MRPVYRDRLYISPISGAHLKNENEIQDLMHQVIGLAIGQILQRDESLSLHELIDTLWHLKESSGDVTMCEACSRAIHFFAGKLN